MTTKKENPQFALKTLKDISKKLGMKKVRDGIYNLGTLREIKASVFALTLEVDIMNSEWDNLSEDWLIKLLLARFKCELDFTFDKLKKDTNDSQEKK